mgnify:CR=1 FL=1|jgi:hypothetical protein|tara:strand:- start:1499 stop:1801 length:303 start_codon:yes stop_codon:yes gene_type:complete
MSIILTNKDRMALNELLTHAYSFTLTGGAERNLEGMQFIINAPGRTRTWYTGSGISIVEAVDSWFERISTAEGIRLRKEASQETLQEVKENEAEIIMGHD